MTRSTAASPLAPWRRPPGVGRWALFGLVGAALLLQSLYPSGYMPGSLASGWVAMLCPEGLPTAFVRQLNAAAGHGHHQHHGHPTDAQQTEHAGGDMPLGSCQLGSALDQPGDLGQPASGASPVELAEAYLPESLLLRTGGAQFVPRSRGPPYA